MLCLEAGEEFVPNHKTGKVLPPPLLAERHVSLVQRYIEGSSHVIFACCTAKDCNFVQAHEQPMKAAADQGRPFEVLRRHRQAGEIIAIMLDVLEQPFYPD